YVPSAYAGRYPLPLLTEVAVSPKRYIRSLFRQARRRNGSPVCEATGNGFREGGIRAAPREKPCFKNEGVPLEIIFATAMVELAIKSSLDVLEPGCARCFT